MAGSILFQEGIDSFAKSCRVTFDLQFSQSRFQQLLKFDAIEAMTARFKVIFQLGPRPPPQVIIDVVKYPSERFVAANAPDGLLLLFHDCTFLKE